MSDLIEEMLGRQPLVGFSPYTDGQVATLRRLGRDFLDMLDRGDINAVIVEGYGLFWLWVLGAFEVVRTMTSAPDCFSVRLNGELQALRRDLSRIRAPFAKQALEGKHQAIANEASMTDDGGPDIGFTVESVQVSARALIERFDATMAGVTRTDVLKDYRRSDRWSRKKSRGPQAPQ